MVESMEEKKNIVLFVDDEPNVLTAIKRAVEDEPYVALFAGSAGEALQILEKRTVSAIITDMRMPGMDGLTLLKIVREKYPRTVRIVLSGYTQLSQVLATVNQGDIFQFISKPWKMEEELLVTVRQAIDRYNLEAERDTLQEGLAQKNQAYLHIFRAMEQKLINEKRDLVSLKNINHWMFTFWKQHVAMCSMPSAGKIETAQGHVDLIEEILLMYMDLLPTVFEGRSIEQVLVGIVNACKGRVSIDRKRETVPVFHGYYGFLEMVFKLLVYLQTSKPADAVSFTMSVEPKNTDYYFVVFDCAIVETADQTRLKIGYAMLNELGKAYRLRIIPKTGSGGLEGVRLVWQAMLADAEGNENNRI